jgi:hypothetical protein
MTAAIAAGLRGRLININRRRILMSSTRWDIARPPSDQAE